MTQEVQIVLTLEVDVEKSKKDIEKFFYDMEKTYTRTVSRKNRMELPNITLVEIKEEAEIYGNEVIPVEDEGDIRRAILEGVGEVMINGKRVGLPSPQLTGTLTQQRMYASDQARAIFNKHFKS
jgi:hypothetical protein